MRFAQQKSCPHVEVLTANVEVVTDELFPEYFSQNSSDALETEEEEADSILTGSTASEEDLNPEDIICKKLSTQVTFNSETGLWECYSASQYQPKEMTDLDLVQCTGDRLLFVRPDNFLQSGFYRGPDLIPSLVNSDGSQKDCPCHAGFVSAEFPEARAPLCAGEVKVYCRDGPLLCRRFQVPCLSGDCNLNYQGVEHCIFFGTSSGIGQEIFWDFVSCMIGGKFSFTKFCQEKTRTYLTTNSKSALFLSNKTFIDLFFAWIVSFKIDFRKEIDPWCQYNPKILACDGTKVGVAVTQQKLQSPMTQLDTEETVYTHHKKLYRCLLPYPPHVDGETKASHEVRCEQGQEILENVLTGCTKRCEDVV